MSYAPSVVKSIQEFTITLGAGNTDDTTGISAVVAAKAVVLPRGPRADATADAANGARTGEVSLGSTTTARARRVVGTGTVIVSGVVLEYY